MTKHPNTNVICHKWHGECEVLSIDGKFCTIRFLEWDKILVKRVQTRMLSVPAALLTVTTPRSRRGIVIDLCSCKRLTRNSKFGKCLHCHIRSLRSYAAEIDRLKNDIAASISAPNREKWDAMNSQQQKLCVFRAMELGFIEWKIESKSMAA